MDEIASEVALLTSQTEDLTPTEVDNAAESLEAIVETNSTSPDVSISLYKLQQQFYHTSVLVNSFSFELGVM